MTTRMIRSAATVAHRAHSGQLRKVLLSAYIAHPERVAAKAAEFGLSEDAQAAAWLHDVVEDTDMTFESLVEMGEFSAATLDLVKRLTKWWSDSAPSDVKASNKPVYYAGILASREATALKVIDRTDNLKDFARMAASPNVTRSTLRWAEKYLAKTEAEMVPLVTNVAAAIASEYFAALDVLRVAIGSVAL